MDPSLALSPTYSTVLSHLLLYILCRQSLSLVMSLSLVLVFVSPFFFPSLQLHIFSASVLISVPVHFLFFVHISILFHSRISMTPYPHDSIFIHDADTVFFHVCPFFHVSVSVSLPLFMSLYLCVVQSVHVFISLSLVFMSS